MLDFAEISQMHRTVGLEKRKKIKEGEEFKHVLPKPEMSQVKKANCGWLYLHSNIFNDPLC